MKGFVISIAAVLVFIYGCNDQKESKTVQLPTIDSANSVNPDADSIQRAIAIADSIKFALAKDSTLLQLTDRILKAFKSRNYRSVADHIDPVQGVRFSPYAYVDTLKNVVLSKRKFIEQAGKTEQDMIKWGEFDGSGDPINMTLNQYIQRFVYDVDFAKPEKRSVNEFLNEGNSLNNLLSVYTSADFTASYFSGFDEKYQGLDWKTLRLVFQLRNKRYYLVGIVHDEWTI